MQGVITPLALVGLGAVGLRLALRWQSAGLELRGFSRSRASRERARSHGLVCDDELVGAIDGARGIVLCVGAPAIPEVAEALAAVLRRRAAQELPVCLHTSGGQGSEPLGALRDLGCAVGSLHPLAAFAVDGAGPDLTKAWCAIDGQPRAREAAEQLTTALGARALVLSDAPDAALRYHAAATLLSNGTVALAAMAIELAGEACIEPEQARRAFLALLDGTVANLREASPERALTGPAARGESHSVRAHMELLADRPDMQAAYRALTRHMLALAQRDGRLSSEAARDVERELGS